MPSVRNIRAGRSYVELYLENNAYVRGLKLAETRLRAFGRVTSQVGRQMMMFAGAAAVPLAIATRTFIGFEDQMLAVKAVTGAVGREFDRLNDQAKELGRTTSFTAADVAGGQLSLGRSGFDPAEIEAAIPGVLNLARATGTDLAEAAKIAAGTLRGFGLEVSQMGRVTDVLVATANNSAQTLEELGESMKYAAPIAEEYGMTLEQTAKALGVLANMQIKGSMAGTSMRQIMLRLADPSVQKQLRAIGVEALSTTGNLRPLGDVLLDVGKAMQSMNNAQRLSLGKELFDRRAVGAALKLAKSDFPALSDAIDNAAGAAKRTAEVMDSGLGGAMRRLLSATEGVQIAVGKALGSALDALGARLTEISRTFSKWIERNEEFVVSAAKVVGAIGVTGMALTALGVTANLTASVIGGVTIAVRVLGVAFMVLSAHPVVAALAMIGVAAGAVAIAVYKAASATAELTDEMEKALAAGDKQRQADAEHISRLTELSQKQKLTSDEFRQAHTLIGELSDRYGKLGIVLDALTGKITGLAAAQANLNREQRTSAESQIKGAIEESERNLKELAAGKVPKGADPVLDVPAVELNMARFSSSRKSNRIPQDVDTAEGVVEPYAARFSSARERRLSLIHQATLAETEKLTELRARLQAMEKGDSDAATGEGAESPADRQARVTNAITNPKSDAALEMEKRGIRELIRLRIEGTENAHKRAVQLVKLEYGIKIAEAKKAGASIALAERVRDQALANVDANFARRKAEEKKQIDEERAQWEEDRSRRIARLEIQTADMDEPDKQLALLKLDRKYAMEEAREKKLDFGQVAKEFDLRKKLMESSFQAPKVDFGQARGSYSAFAMQGMSGGADSIRERTAKATEKTAKGIEKIEKRGRLPRGIPVI